MAKNLAAALNEWIREGRDILGRADGAALGDIITEFIEEPGSSSGSSSEESDGMSLI